MNNISLFCLSSLITAVQMVARGSVKRIQFRVKGAGCESSRLLVYILGRETVVSPIGKVLNIKHLCHIEPVAAGSSGHKAGHSWGKGTEQQVDLQRLLGCRGYRSVPHGAHMHRSHAMGS